MIIDSQGNILETWERKNGCTVYDANYTYEVDFYVVIPYTDEQKAKYAEIKALKKKLKDTDYKAIKYAEGLISEEKYAEIKAERAAWRERINNLYFDEPTLTREEIDNAERLAIEKLKESEVGDADS